MSLNYVTLILDGFDAGNNQLGLGTVTFTPSVQLSDPTDHEWIPPAPQTTVFRGGLASPQVSLLATDNANVLPLGWAWQVSFQNVPGSPAPFSFFLPHAGGATQYLSAQQPVSSVVTQFPANPMTTPGDMIYGGTSGVPLRLPIGPSGYVLGSNGADPSWVPDGGATVKVPAPAGATATDTPNVTAAIANLVSALSFGPATLLFQDGTYQLDSNSAVIRSVSNFAVKGTGATVISQAPNRSGLANNVGGNIFTIADCTDFRVEGITLDGLRDTVAPITALTASASSGQPSVTVASGQGARYLAGQRLNVFGGLGSSDQNLVDGFASGGLTILSITAGGGSGGGDLITFTSNLANSYTQISSTPVSDPYGPYAAAGAYVTPYQTGSATVAGRALIQEDQQCGLHLLSCQRFKITGCTSRNLWESPIRMGTHRIVTSVTDGSSYGTIADNILYHGYDQGIGIWTSDHITVTGNVVSSCGWAGICCTLSDDCTITGNVTADNVYQVAGDLIEGNGVAIEGGARNVVGGNIIKGNYGMGVYLTQAGTQPFGMASPVATTIASASNAAALPQGTVNVASTAGFASSGTFAVISSAGVQLIAYTNTSGGNSFTGCTGGIGTLYTGQEVMQSPVFISNGGTPLPVGSTSVPVTDGTKFTAGGRYSIVDGPKTERIQVSSISTNTLTLTGPTAFGHWDKAQIGTAVSEDNVISGNTITGGAGLATGVRLAVAVRTAISGNTIHGTLLSGIDGYIWAAGGGGSQVAPWGTTVTGNTITEPGVTGTGNASKGIHFLQVSGVSITGNRVSGPPAVTTSGWSGIYLQGCTDLNVEGNVVSDPSGQGIRLDVINEWTCKRIRLAGNLVQRTIQEGIQVFGGDSLIVTGNIVRGCAPRNGPGGFGGGLDIRGCSNSFITENLCIDNGVIGLMIDSALINSVTVNSTGNYVERNVVRDDGMNIDAFNGAASQQATGIKETSGSGPNTYWENIVSGNGTNWSLAANGSALYNNTGIASTSLALNTTGTAANVTATLDLIPAAAASVNLNSQKLTALANGAAASDSAALGQVPSAGGPATPGLIAWNYDPMNNAGNGAACTNGTVYCQRIDLRYTATIAKVWFIITAAAVTPTAGQNYVGVYNSAGTLLGYSEVDALITSTNAQFATLTVQGGQSLTSLAPGIYYVALMFNAATPPSLLKGTSNGNYANFGSAAVAGTYRQCVGGTVQTSLPATATFVSAGNNSFFAGVA